MHKVCEEVAALLGRKLGPSDGYDEDAVEKILQKEGLIEADSSEEDAEA
jgi:hypothetical protein